MANELKGKSTASITWIAPNEKAVEALRIFFEGHYEFMKNKSYREGPLKLVQYVVSESPEYAGLSEFFDGKYPKKTGGTIFNLFEVYETEDGLHHHWIETKEIAEELWSMVQTYNLEWVCFNQMKVMQSLLE